MSRRTSSGFATTAGTGSDDRGKSSLERLGLERIDIAFVHDPDDFYAEALDQAFPAL